MRRNTLISLMAFFICLFLSTNALAADSCGTGIDGDLTVSAGTVNIDQWYNSKYGANQYSPGAGKVPNFNNVYIAPGATLTASKNFTASEPWAGQLVFKATGTVTVEGSIDVTGKGYINEGSAMGGNVSTAYTYSGGGGGGGNATTGVAGSQGRDGSYYSSGGVGGSALGVSNASMFGSPGGDTRQYDTEFSISTANEGSPGGGYINIIANKIIVGINGKILANGANGLNTLSSAYGYAGGTGGGAGGIIELIGRDINIGINKVKSLGGNGGNGYSSTSTRYTGAGGKGGSGAVKIKYDTAFTGTSDNQSDGSFVSSVIDITPPTGTFNINENAANTGGIDIVLNFTATDARSIVTNVIVSNYSDFSFSQSLPYQTAINWRLLPGEGQRNVYAKLVDSAGNTSDALTATINVINDTVPPTIRLNINGGADFTTTSIASLTIEAEDNLSAPDKLQMRLSNNGGSTFGSWTPYSVKVDNYSLGTTGGLKTVCVQVKDANGNIGNGIKSIYYSKTGEAESTPSDATSTPAAVTTVSENLNGSVININSMPTMMLQGDTVTLALTNINTSAGPVQLYTSFDGVNWSPPDPVPDGSSTYNKTFSFTREGTVGVSYKLKNSYGAESPVYTRYYMVDRTKPEIEVNTASGYTATSATTIKLNITAKDNVSTQSQLYYTYKVERGGTVVQNYAAYAALPVDGTITANLSSTAGPHVITVKVIDRAGNASSKTITVRKL